MAEKDAGKAVTRNIRKTISTGHLAMVELGEKVETSRASRDRLANAISDALAEGISERDLLNMVTTAAVEQVAEQPKIPGLFPDAEPIYTEDDVPDGLIDLPSAARKHGHRITRLQRWVQRGHLKVYGRMRAPARGGGYLLLSEDELIARMRAEPNKGGRPRKII